MGVTVNLLDGNAIPAVGYGVYQVPDDAAEVALTHAIKCGYRSVDTAAMYGNEAGVGRAVRASAVPRSELFVTTKLWNDDQGYDTTMRAFEKSLSTLGLGYVDMYLIHWPLAKEGKFVDTFRAFQKLKADGLVRSIGVSNFTRAHLEELIEATGEVPVVNQVELHPRLAQNELREFHASLGIVTEAWGPLGQGSTLSIPEIVDIAAAQSKTAAQVVLRWHLQRGTVVIPKSAAPERIESNFAVFDFELTDEQMTLIDGLDTGDRIGADPDIMCYPDIQRDRKLLRRSSLQPRHHVTPEVAPHRGLIVGVQTRAGNRGEIDDHPGHPLRGLGDVGRRVDVAAVAGGDHIVLPEGGQVGHQALDPDPRAGGELVGLAQAELHDQGTRCVVGAAAVGHAGRQLGVELGQSGQGPVCIGPERIVEPHDRGAEQRGLIGEVPVQPRPGHPGGLGHLEHGGRPNALGGEAFLGGIEEPIVNAAGIDGICHGANIAKPVDTFCDLCTVG